MLKLTAQMLASVALYVNLACIAQATVITSNLGNSFSGSLVVRDDLRVAQSFTTNNTTYTFDSITVSLLGNASTSDVEFALWDNDSLGNVPGSIINNLSGPGMPTTFTEYTYLPTASVTLAANTKYWIVAQTQLGGDYRWVRTLDTTEIGPGTLGGITGGQTGSSWSGQETTDSALFLSVEGTIVPEPSALALASFGVICLSCRRRKWA